MQNTKLIEPDSSHQKWLILTSLQPEKLVLSSQALKTYLNAKLAIPSQMKKNPCDQSLPGFKPSIPVVFSSFFPVDTGDYQNLKEALQKLSLNDASFIYEPETSAALGFGFRCGFLGLLHMEIIQERLEREFDLDLINTAPSVVYKIYLTNNTMTELHNPADMPEVTKIEKMEEPWVKATILLPDQYLGDILKLCTERRGQQIDLTYAGNRAMVVYKLPLNEIVFDFYDRLKIIIQRICQL